MSKSIKLKGGQAAVQALKREKTKSQLRYKHTNINTDEGRYRVKILACGELDPATVFTVIGGVASTIGAYYGYRATPKSQRRRQLRAKNNQKKDSKSALSCNIFKGLFTRQCTGDVLKYEEIEIEGVRYL